MDHILLKGIKNNNGEFGLIYFTYNFRRVMNIIGFAELIKRLRKLFFLSCSLLHAIGVDNAEKNFQLYSILWDRMGNRKISSFGFSTN